jgi:hypothetical protein
MSLFPVLVSSVSQTVNENRWPKCKRKAKLMLIILINMLCECEFGFWDVALCSLLEVCWHFTGTYCFHLQGQRVSWGSFFCLITVCLLGLLFDHEDGGSTFLQNVYELLPGWMALHLRRWYSSHSLQWEPQIYKIWFIPTYVRAFVLLSWLSLTVMLHSVYTNLTFFFKNAFLLKLQAIKYYIIAVLI